MVLRKSVSLAMICLPRGNVRVSGKQKRMNGEGCMKKKECRVDEFRNNRGTTHIQIIHLPTHVSVCYSDSAGIKGVVRRRELLFKELEDMILRNNAVSKHMIGKVDRRSASEVRDGL